jgi:transposase
MQRGLAMSLKLTPIQPVPDETNRVARAAFPKGNPYLTLRDRLGTIFADDDFADLFPGCGQPSEPPWRLALVTIMQFREHLADRQAAEAVRARIDWKYLLGLDLTEPGFDFSVLSEFRARLLTGSAEDRLLEKLLEGCRTQGLLKARGRQRTDSTHVLASIRVLSRMELVAETLHAALNELATVAPDWLRALAPLEWFDRYKRRIEDTRLPQEKAAREVYMQTVGADGFRLLDALSAPEAPAGLGDLPMVAALRQTWLRHYDRTTPEASATCGTGGSPIQVKPKHELSRATEGIESPYDPEARYRNKGDTQWVGYMAHFSETCEDAAVHLITHTHTTPATVHEAQCTEVIHQGLLKKGLLPREHLVDSAYISAELLVSSRHEHGIALIGPPRPDSSWQANVEGAYSLDQFAIDWDHQQMQCPQGKVSIGWKERLDYTGHPYIQVSFRTQDCQACGSRALCTRAAAPKPRVIKLQPRLSYEALQLARASSRSEEGLQLYASRAGVEGTVSQGVRTCGLRRTRYRGLSKVHLQNVAIAAAINVDRLVAWFEDRPRAKTRTSRFAALAPEYAMGPG